MRQTGTNVSAELDHSLGPNESLQPRTSSSVSRPPRAYLSGKGGGLADSRVLDGGAEGAGIPARRSRWISTFLPARSWAEKLAFLLAARSRRRRATISFLTDASVRWLEGMRSSSLMR